MNNKRRRPLVILHLFYSSSPFFFLLSLFSHIHHVLRIRFRHPLLEFRSHFFGTHSRCVHVLCRVMNAPTCRIDAKNSGPVMHTKIDPAEFALERNGYKRVQNTKTGSLNNGIISIYRSPTYFDSSASNDIIKY